jgi:hypothetical protein
LRSWRPNSVAKSRTPKKENSSELTGGAGWRSIEVLLALVLVASERELNHAIRALPQVGSALFSDKHSENGSRSRAVWSVHQVQNQIH